MNNIQFVSDTMRCSGCGACSAICPKNAIEYKWSSMGRLYASVNNACVGCGMCQKVCPSIDYIGLKKKYDDPCVGNIQKVYVGKANDKNIFDNAQSGGLCTAVLKYLFDSHQIDAAVVTRMTPASTPIVSGVVVTSVDELYACQKSCYTPVNVLTALNNIKSYKSVAVVGVPCHIQGLTALMECSTKYRNVKYKLGLVCDRTLCSTVQDVMVKLSGVHSDNVTIEWRKKNFKHKGAEYKYENAPVVVSTNDEIRVLPNAYRFALKEYFTPPRCRECIDKINVHADIVFGDPWRMPNLDLEYGASLVIARTSEGCLLMDSFAKMKLANLQIRSREEAVAGQLIEEKRNKDADAIQEKNRIFIEREKKSKERVVQDAVDLIKSQYSIVSRIKAKLKRIKKRIVG